MLYNGIHHNVMVLPQQAALYTGYSMPSDRNPIVKKNTLKTNDCLIQTRFLALFGLL